MGKIRSNEQISLKDIEKMNKHGIPLLQIHVRNFLSVCDVLATGDRKFGDGRIKIYAETGRFNYHRLRRLYL